MQQPDLTKLSPTLKNIVLMPSDPSVQLTDVQLNALFGGEVLPALREMVRIALTNTQQTQNNTEQVASAEGVLNG